jgi:hypothetical protein
MANAGKKRVTCLCILLALLGSVLSASGAEMADPERQSSMFKRIFSYDKDLRGSARIVVILVGPDKGAADTAKVSSVFREKGFFPAVVTTSQLTDELVATLTPDSTVVYVMPGVAYETVKQFAASKGYLSISGIPSLAEAGHVSVSVDVAGDQPEIVVNLPRLQTERHELSSELLNLARVIR